MLILIQQFLNSMFQKSKIQNTQDKNLSQNIEQEQQQTKFQQQNSNKTQNQVSLNKIQTQKANPDLQQKFQAVFLLACLGDTLGYKNGQWEFEYDGKEIHRQYNKLTNNQGMKNFAVSEKWKYSDDTVMHIATGKALLKIDQKQSKLDLNQAMQIIGIYYKKCWKYMPGRAPGPTTQQAIYQLQNDGKNWDKLKFSNSGGGCGGSMRSACIGLYFPYPQKLDDLIAVSIESCRITHHHPTGYLGSLVSALFTSLAIAGISMNTWGAILLKEVIPKVKEYIKKADREVYQNLNNFDYFINHFQDYMKERNLSFDPKIDKEPIFPKNYDIKQREEFYSSISFSGWGGASGHDSVIIAYDALLSSKLDWEQLIQRGVLHGGDCDSTGTIACAWYGAIKGFEGVPKKNYSKLEDHQLILELADNLYKKCTNQN